MQVHYGTENLHIVNPVVTMGSFDGVHKGHIRVIESLKKVARKLKGESVIISFEPHPREILYPREKGPGILTTLNEKISILESRGIDHLIILQFTHDLANMEYDQFVRNVLVDWIGMKGMVIGYDHRFGKNREGSFETLIELSKQYRFYLEQEDVYEEQEINVSSTKIRNALQIGDIRRVKEFLGYDYMISGKVVYGDKIGRGMGFPTANLRLDDDRKLLPAVGVYAVKVWVEGKEYEGMLNVGVRPTITRIGIVCVEVNIFDFDCDIYGKIVRIELIDRIRGERKFEKIEGLKEQLAQDREVAREMLR